MSTLLLILANPSSHLSTAPDSTANLNIIQLILSQTPYFRASLSCQAYFKMKSNNQTTHFSTNWPKMLSTVAVIAVTLCCPEQTGLDFVQCLYSSYCHFSVFFVCDCSHYKKFNDRLVHLIITPQKVIHSCQNNIFPCIHIYIHVYRMNQ